MSITRYELVCREWEFYDLEPDDHGDWCSWEDVEPLLAERDALAARVKELEAVLQDIAELAHDRSTGPTVPDDLWAVRRMAYRVLTTPPAGEEEEQ